MPLGKNVRFRAKRINSKYYERLAFKGNKVIEAKKMKYKHPHLLGDEF